MATIRRYTQKGGKAAYHVQIRVKGYPSQNATFDRLTDAKLWAQKTESALREGRHFPDRQKRKRTFGDMVDRFVATELTKRRPRDQAEALAIFGAMELEGENLSAGWRWRRGVFIRKNVYR